MRALRLEFLLKTNSGYPKNLGVMAYMFNKPTNHGVNGGLLLSRRGFSRLGEGSTYLTSSLFKCAAIFQQLRSMLQVQHNTCVRKGNLWASGSDFGTRFHGFFSRRFLGCFQGLTSLDVTDLRSGRIGRLPRSIRDWTIICHVQSEIKRGRPLIWGS